MAQLFSTLFFPVFPFLLHILVVLVFMAIALHLSSAGEAQYKVAYPVSHSLIDFRTGHWT